MRPVDNGVEAVPDSTARRTSPSRRGPKPRPAPREDVVNVLLIQEDAEYGRHLEEMLGEAAAINISPARARDFAAGLDLLRHQPPGLVLLDISSADPSDSPPGDRPGLASIARIQRIAPEVPIVVLTDCDDEGLGMEAVEQGAQDHLMKRGLTSGLLVRTIQYAIQRHRMLAEFRRYNRELQSSEERIRTIITNSAEGIVVVDDQGKTCYVNPAAEALFRRPARKLVGEPFSLPLVAGRTTEVDIAYQDSAKRSVEIRAVNIHWEGRPANLVSLHDVTERRRLEEMKSDFLATVSHELRTPLSSIKNAVEILSQGRAGDVGTTQGRFLAMVSRNVERLSGLINELLDFSRLEAGQIGFRFSETDVKQILRLMFATFEPQAEAKGLILKLECPPDIPSVYADPVRIDQAMSNLISNALKFTPGGGMVCLSARESASSVELCVADTGVGISVEHQNRIFERFYQVEDTLNRGSQGTGLGLCIAKELVEAHGGEIQVESALGKGTLFRVRLLSYSSRAVEAVELESELRRQRGVGVVSLVVITLAGSPAGSPPTGQDDTGEALLRSLADTLRPVLRAADQIVLQPASGRLVIFLPKTPRAGAGVAKHNIEEHLTPGTLAAGGTLPVEARVLGPVSYPYDGTTARELISKAERMRELRVRDTG